MAFLVLSEGITNLFSTALINKIIVNYYRETQRISRCSKLVVAVSFAVVFVRKKDRTAIYLLEDY